MCKKYPQLLFQIPSNREEIYNKIFTEPTEWKKKIFSIDDFEKVHDTELRRKRISDEQIYYQLVKNYG